MNTVMNSRSLIVAILGVSLMTGACKQNNDGDSHAAEAQRTAENAQREANNAQQEANNAQQEARRTAEQAAEAQRQAEQQRQAEVMRQAELQRQTETARRAETMREIETPRQAETTRQMGNNPTGPVPSPTARLALTDALRTISSARCEHEQRCNHIGTGRRYESAQTCRTVVRNDFSQGLNARDCASVDHQELSECMAEIRSEDCNSPIDTLQRLAACRTAGMCSSTVSMR